MSCQVVRGTAIEPRRCWPDFMQNGATVPTALQRRIGHHCRPRARPLEVASPSRNGSSVRARLDQGQRRGQLLRPLRRGKQFVGAAPDSKAGGDGRRCDARLLGPQRDRARRLSRQRHDGDRRLRHSSNEAAEQGRAIGSGGRSASWPSRAAGDVDSAPAGGLLPGMITVTLAKKDT
jgi:hypothetical protein